MKDNNTHKDKTGREMIYRMRTISRPTLYPDNDLNDARYSTATEKKGRHRTLRVNKAFKVTGTPIETDNELKEGKEDDVF